MVVLDAVDGVVLLRPHEGVLQGDSIGGALFMPPVEDAVEEWDSRLEPDVRHTIPRLLDGGHFLDPVVEMSFHYCCFF